MYIIAFIKCVAAFVALYARCVHYTMAVITTVVSNLFITFSLYFSNTVVNEKKNIKRKKKHSHTNAAYIFHCLMFERDD